MKKKIIFVMILFLVLVQLVFVSEIQATDKIKISSFKSKYIRVCLKKYDKNKDGYIGQKELKKVTDLDIYADTVKGSVDFKGVEQLRYLESICVEGMYKFKVKNFDKLYQLKKIKYISFEKCVLNEINAGRFAKLRHFKWKGGKNKKITFGKKNKNVNVVEIVGANIKTINLRHMANLEVLKIVNKTLKKVDLRNCKKLNDLSLNLPKLQEISVKHNMKLAYINIYSEEITKINLNKNKKIKMLELNCPKITELDVSKNNRIRYLICNGIEEITGISKLPKLYYLVLNNVIIDDWKNLN